MMRYRSGIALFACGALLWCAPHSVLAVQVGIGGEGSIHARLDTFYVPVRIDVQDECINAATVSVVYDVSEVTVRDVATGKSIFTLWTERPLIHTDKEGKEIGRVSFEGGIPGGYCGRVGGDPGNTNILAELVVSGVPKAEGIGVRTETRFYIDPKTEVYLNDGLGTRANTTFMGATIALEQREGKPQNVWVDDLWNDKISPEYFEITLVEGPSVGNPRHYIVFSTVDKQSGISHYEVLETDPDRFGFLSWVSREAHWVRAESPYVLRDQKLHSKIMVKAVDKNGNERIASYVPPIPPLVVLTSMSFVVPALFFGLLLAMLAMLVYAMRRRADKKEVRDVADNHLQ